MSPELRAKRHHEEHDSITKSNTKNNVEMFQEVEAPLGRVCGLTMGLF